MANQINLPVSKLRMILPILMFLIILSGCTPNNLLDVNMDVPDHSWLYAKSIKATVEIKDPSQPYQIYFKIRNTSDYRYANLYVIMKIKGNGRTKSTRYQFKLAKVDGEWLGKGSGDLFTNNFLMLKNYRFEKAGKYEIEVEQNMRDNPLMGISDIGLSLEKRNP